MTDEKASQTIRALFATGFFKDVSIEADDGVVVVVVQERPSIAQIEFTGMREFDKETVLKAMNQVGLAEGRIFDKGLLDRAEQELKRQYLSRGQLRRQRQHHRDAARAQPRRAQLRDRGRRCRQDPADQHHRQPDLQRARAAEAALSAHARHPYLVQQSRSVFAPEARGRSGDPALLLSRPRLSRVQHRIDAGVDHAGQERHLHHGRHY